VPFTLGSILNELLSLPQPTNQNAWLCYRECSFTRRVLRCVTLRCRREAAGGRLAEGALGGLSAMKVVERAEVMVRWPVELSAVELTRVSGSLGALKRVHRGSRWCGWCASCEKLSPSVCGNYQPHFWREKLDGKRNRKPHHCETVLRHPHKP
jgi:hypothetical protein